MSHTIRHAAISAAAATALIAKAQVVTAAFLAGIPVTGGEGTAVPATATASVLGELSKPTPLGGKLVHQAQWDALALQVVESVGFSTFEYDLYQLPVNTAWEDTLAYYTTEAAAVGALHDLYGRGWLSRISALQLNGG